MTDREIMQQALDALKLHLLHHEHGCVYLNPVMYALEAALAQPEQEPKPAFTKFVISNEQYEIVPTTNALTQRIEYLEAEVKCEEKRFNDLWDSFAALVNKKPWIGLTDDEKTEAIAKFDDPQVQVVYEILCNDEDPPKGEHWEGFIARRIVDALAQPEQEELIQFKDGKWSYVRKPWVGLTDEEILSAAKEVPITCIRQRDYDLHFAPIIEAKLKDKNTT